MNGSTGEGFSVNFSELTITTGASVPEPATLALVSLGMLGVGLSRRKKFKAA
ncbi:MAG: PEP-CTERM sorting domain-containing protein [Motiliproteus sp.]|nr:PEP-CTERM sorting domain-containing protein [Motiliproteus sp.]MCW9053445.1 PEP-CTERM sorting domain-containing protein [Motiliproteus sp.]